MDRKLGFNTVKNGIQSLAFLKWMAKKAAVPLASVYDPLDIFFRFIYRITTAHELELIFLGHASPKQIAVIFGRGFVTNESDAPCNFPWLEFLPGFASVNKTVASK